MQNARCATTALTDTSSQLDIMYQPGVAILAMPNKRNISNGGDVLLHHQ